MTWLAAGAQRGRVVITRDGVTEKLFPDGNRAVSFGEFGVALVAEVCTPQQLHTLLVGALDLLRRSDALAGVASAWIDTPTLLRDNGYERSFGVTIRAELVSRLGPRLWATGIHTTVDLELTMRLSISEPAVIQLVIDPVTSDKLRFRARARTDWLPVPLLDGGGMTRLARSAERSLSIFSATVNRAIDRYQAQLRLDVLDYLRNAHRPGGPIDEGGGGTAEKPQRAGNRSQPVAVVGERISFAEFGGVLIRGALDAQSVAILINTALAPGARFAFDGPLPLQADIAARLASITMEPDDGDELLFRVTLDLDVELDGPRMANPAVLVVVMRVQVVLRVTTLINPAALLVRIQPVSPKDVRLRQVRGTLRGRWLTLPGHALSWLLRGLLADELNHRLHHLDRHIGIAELLATGERWLSSTDRPPH